MKTDRARVKLNPVTKKTGIEGLEQFVKTFFNKITAMLSGTKKAVTKAPIKEKPVKEKTVKKPGQSKKATVAKGKKPVKQSKGG